MAIPALLIHEDHDSLERSRYKVRGENIYVQKMQSPVSEKALPKNTEQVTQNKNGKTSPFHTLSSAEDKTWPTENSVTDNAENVALVKSAIRNTKDEKRKKILCDVVDCPIREKVRKEKFCGVPNCPAKALKKVSKESIEIEKSPYNIRKNFLALTNFFLQKDVCKLSKNEKKVWKRMKSDTVGQTEEFINLRGESCTSKKGLTEILYERIPPKSMRSRMRDGKKKKMSKTTSCAMVDCPIVAKKLLIEEYNNKLEDTGTEKDIAVQESDSHPRSEKPIEATTFHPTQDHDVLPEKVPITKLKEDLENRDIPVENEGQIYNVTEENYNKINTALELEATIENNSKLNSNEQTVAQKSGLPRSKKFFNLDNLAQHTDSYNKK